jgi:hypothetical protein
MIRDLLDLLFGNQIEVAKTAHQGKALTISLKEWSGRRFITVSSRGVGDFQFYVFDKASFGAWPDDLRHLKGILTPWAPRLNRATGILK